MDAPERRIGRPRRYSFPPAAGYAHPHAAWAVAALDELSERLFDLIADLPAEVLDCRPSEELNSIAMLTVHVAEAEAGWIARATNQAVPRSIRDALSAGRGRCPSPYTADQLEDLCRRVRREVTQPFLGPVRELDAEIGDGDRAVSPRGALMHLIWHGSYHMGQVGYLRYQAGLDYQWTFDGRIVGTGPD